MDSTETQFPEKPLTTWADQIADVLREEVEPVILVGHSRAGIVISEAAERVPEKVALLVYLSAYLSQDGQNINEVAQTAENAALFAEAVEFHSDGTATLTADGLQRLLYNRTPESFVQPAKSRIVPEPTAAFITPVHLTPQRFGAVRRAYIECAHDCAIPLALQHAMHQATPAEVVERLNSDHWPFFSMPDGLVDALKRIQQAILKL